MFYVFGVFIAIIGGTPDKRIPEGLFLRFSTKYAFYFSQITHGGGLNRNHKFSSSLYKDIIRCRKLVSKKAKEGGSLNHLLSLQRCCLRYKITKGEV